MTRNDLLQLLITESHVHPERGEWPVCVGIAEYGGLQEFTVLSGLKREPRMQAYFISAIPQSQL